MTDVTTVILLLLLSLLVLFKMLADGDASQGDGANFCQGFSPPWVGVVARLPSGIPFNLKDEGAGLGDIREDKVGELVELEHVELGEDTLSDLALAISKSLAPRDELKAILFECFRDG